MFKVCVGASAALVCGLAASVFAGDISQVNGVFMQNRVFNDFPTSTLVPTANYPALVGWHEEFPAGTTGNFANKHLAYLSTDGGASAFGLDGNQGWTLSTTVQISAPNGAPRKEGALQIENPRPNNVPAFVDEGHLLVASDGEVAMFGASMPFFSSNITGGPWYTLGSLSRLTFQYFAPGVMDPTKGALQITMVDPILGFHQSPVLVWGNEADGTVGFNTGTKIAFQAQNQRNPFINDSSDIFYGSTSIVPTPGALALLGLGGLAASRRRR